MVTKENTLKRLRKEADYEESLVKTLTDYFLVCLDDLEELSNKEKEKLKKSLTHIRDDSLEHKNLFEDLINQVLESGENKF
jgi:hypothetical protein